jgi:hypothetical protein
MASYTQFNPTRLRSYILRLPLATRLLLLAIVGLWIATIPLPWLREFARLEPAKMDLTQSMSTSFACWSQHGDTVGHCLNPRHIV